LLLADISFNSGSLVLEQAKLAILCASVSSGIFGLMCLMHRRCPQMQDRLQNM
jgi:Na+/H+ antiporter NhaA